MMVKQVGMQNQTTGSGDNEFPNGLAKYLGDRILRG